MNSNTTQYVGGGGGGSANGKEEEKDEEDVVGDGDVDESSFDQGECFETTTTSTTTNCSSTLLSSYWHFKIMRQWFVFAFYKHCSFNQLKQILKIILLKLNLYFNLFLLYIKDLS